MMKLLIDAGNTRIKWALSNDAQETGGWVCKGDLPTAQADRLSEDVAGRLAVVEPRVNLHDIKQIWASNVAGETVAREIRGIAAGLSVEPLFAIASEAQCGVRNGYSSVAQLGSDRWTALISAWHMVKGKCLVVSCGTATTIDTLTAEGEFVGGLILPGVELMRRSLAEAADRLRSAPGAYAPFPLNTADAIFSGAIQASCGAIERQYTLLDDDRAPVVLSGGNAALLKPHFNPEIIKTQARFVDDLVLRGLLVIAGEAKYRC